MCRNDRPQGNKALHKKVNGEKMAYPFIFRKIFSLIFVGVVEFVVKTFWCKSLQSLNPIILMGFK